LVLCWGALVIVFGFWGSQTMVVAEMVVCTTGIDVDERVRLGANGKAEVGVVEVFRGVVVKNDVIFGCMKSLRGILCLCTL
jgi:hypothetical protein